MGISKMLYLQQSFVCSEISSRRFLKLFIQEICKYREYPQDILEEYARLGFGVSIKL